MPGHTKCCTCHAKSSSQNWRSDAPKCNPCQEISALTSQHLWWTCLLYCAYHGKRIFADPPQMSHACHRFWKCYKTLTFCSHFWQGPQSLAPATQNDASTSKSGACMWCFVHFDFEICFAPQRRALFRHLNFQKCSEPVSFWHFPLRNMLRATTACTFSTSQLPKVLRGWGVLYILTWKCASRHNGVQFFISHLASWLRTRRFSEPTFRPSGATNHCKNAVFRDFPTFSRTCIFFLLTLSLLWSSLFCSSLFYASLWLFPSLLFIYPYCRKFDFKTSFDQLLKTASHYQLLLVIFSRRNPCHRFHCRACRSRKADAAGGKVRVVLAVWQETAIAILGCQNGWELGNPWKSGYDRYATHKLRSTGSLKRHFL